MSLKSDQLEILFEVYIAKERKKTFSLTDNDWLDSKALSIKKTATHANANGKTILTCKCMQNLFKIYCLVQEL